MTTYSDTITRALSDLEYYSANDNLMTEVTVTYTYPDAPVEALRVRFSRWHGEAPMMRILNGDGSTRVESEIDSRVWSRMIRANRGLAALSREAIEEFYAEGNK